MSLFRTDQKGRHLTAGVVLITCWLSGCFQSLFLILILLFKGLTWSLQPQALIAASVFVVGVSSLSEGMEGRRHSASNFDLYSPQLSTHHQGTSLCVWSCDMVSFSVPLCRVQGKRKRDSYVRVLGWPVKAPLFPAPWSARLTSSSWSAAYVWTATKTPKYCPACTPSVRGEWSYHDVLMHHLIL